MSCQHGNWDCEICEEIGQAYNAGVASGRKAEREACAKVCDSYSSNASDLCAEAIRARGEVQ